MKTQSCSGALLCAFFFALELSGFGQGSLTPPAAPTPTMKTLDQIDTHLAQAGEKRVDVNPLPSGSGAYSLISASGSYYLSANIGPVAVYQDGIYIDADNVTVDLNGFTISSVVGGGSGNGITVAPGHTNITIRNGHIRGTTTYSNGTFTAGGFNDGIHADSTTSNIVIDHVTVSRVALVGILANGKSVVIHDCTISTTASTGIYAGSASVRDCQADTCGGTGIYCKVAENSSGSSTATSIGLYANETAHNCHGESVGGDGLTALSASNCYGTTSSGTYGLTANAATSCYGYNSSSGTGLNAYTATSCYAYNSSSGTGLNAYTATGCYAYSNTGSGINTSVAIGCWGYSASGTASVPPFGLIAYIANSCRGYGIGVSESITYKYNMP
jgi:hypothetical protein